MDEDPLPAVPPPLLTENDTNNINNIPYLFTPSLLLPSTSSNMNQYYPTNSSSLILHQPPPHITQSCNQFALDNIDWLSVVLSGNSVSSNSMTYDGADDRMPLSTSTVSVLASRNDNNTPINSELGGDSKNKRKVCRTKKSVPPRVAFHTRSSEDVLDDGYKWRKYGQKAVKNTKHPRSYYRCTHHTCNVKKQIQRLSKDNSVVVTTYEGIHNHPCEKLMETLSPLLRQLQFLTRF